MNQKIYILIAEYFHKDDTVFKKYIKASLTKDQIEAEKERCIRNFSELFYEGLLFDISFELEIQEIEADKWLSEVIENGNKVDALKSVA